MSRPARILLLFLMTWLLLNGCSSLRPIGANQSSTDDQLADQIAPPSAIQTGPVGLPTALPTVTPIAGAPSQVDGAATVQPLIGLFSATSLDASDDPTLQPALDAHMQSLAAQGLFSGAVLVAINGEVIHRAGYGMANYEQGIAATPNTRFRLASITKQFTAAAILLLVGDGLINLEDSICVYLSDCPATWRSITVHHLLNHTNGLPNYTDFSMFLQIETQAATGPQLAALFRDLPLNFPPGQAFAYNNSGYVLLGLIIENVSGQSYPDFLQTRIFGPLGMNDSGYDPGDFAPLNGTRGYQVPGNPALALNTSTLYAAGGLYSTVNDLLRWDQALYDDRLLSAPLRTLMFSPGPQNFGYGWRLNEDHGHQRIGHAGNMSGAATFIARYPQPRLTVIVLSNLEYANPVGISSYLAGLVLQ